MSLVLLTCCALGLLSVLFTLLSRFFWRRIQVRGLGLGSVSLLNISSVPVRWKHLAFTQPEDKEFIMKLSSFPAYLLSLSGFKITIRKFRIIVHISSVKVHVHSSLFASKPSKPSSQSSPSSLFWLLKFLPAFEFKCDELQIYLNTGEGLDIIKTMSVCCLTVKGLSLSNYNKLCLDLASLHVDHTVATAETIEVSPVLQLCNLCINFSDDRFKASVSDTILVKISVGFLYFVASFIKHITGFDPDSPEDEPTTAPSTLFAAPSWLTEFSIPHIEVRFVLPETLVDSRVFEYVEFSVNNIHGSAYLDSEPKVSLFSDSLRVSARYENSQSSSKHFCPIDSLLQRGADKLSGHIVNIMTLDRISLCNWKMFGSASASIPATSIKQFVQSILDRKPLWDINNNPIGDFDFKNAFSRQKVDFPLSTRYEVSSVFYRSVQAESRSVYARLASFDFLVPFEFPFANLIDHSVILFKAGWRPLSRKTEKGYWLGDGDKFLKVPWKLHLWSQKCRLRFEDDQFEVRLSTIYHCQRKIAEMRCRLESAFWEQSWPHRENQPTKQQSEIAKSLVISKDHVLDDSVEPFLNLHQRLFSHYQELISQTRIASDWSLLDVMVENAKLSLSWSPEYLGSRSLAELINAIEDGNYMKDDIVDRLATFLGGFFDIETGQLQLAVRNFSKPVLLAPDSRLIGPLFLIEAPVFDPKVLVKFPVKVLPRNHFANIGIPQTGLINVLRSILPLKLYHCIHVSVSQPLPCEFAFSPFWMGCLGLLDRALDRFVKSSTEDPSAPLPGWDKLRYNLRGSHSKISITSPLLVTCIADSDPFVSHEELNLLFPSGLDLGLSKDGVIVLKCLEATLGVRSLQLSNLISHLEALKAVQEWDAMSYSGPFSNFDSLPIIKLTRSHLQLRLDVRNVFGNAPIDHWLVSPVVKANLPSSTDFVS